jgi:1-deoxyxylulose-5-phosphate synthase
MQYTTLGSSGLKISRIALGCMSFGDTSRGFNEWALDDTAAEPLFRQAVELGITFWDTANAYGYGTSEEIVGRAIGKYTRREDVVLATKVFFKMHDGPGGSGLSRRAILEQLDDSLRRLGTDYVDLYQIHRFDPATPVEETMEALHDMVKAGKVRYLGAWPAASTLAASSTAKSPSTRPRRVTRTWIPGRPSRSSSAPEEELANDAAVPFTHRSARRAAGRGCTG